MKLTQITVSYGVTQSLPEYSNIKPNLTLTATIDESDDPSAVELLLWQHAKRAVHEEIDRALESSGKAAKYSADPRFQVVRTYNDHWEMKRRGLPDQQVVVAVLPDGVANVRDRFNQRLSHASSIQDSRNLRYKHAMRVAFYEAERDNGLVVDCTDGELDRLAAALPPLPEPAPTAPTPYDPDWTSPLDDDSDDDSDDDDDEELDAEAEEAERQHEMSKDPL